MYSSLAFGSNSGPLHLWGEAWFLLHPFSQVGVLLVLFKKDSNHAPVCEELVLSNVDLKHQSSLLFTLLL